MLVIATTLSACDDGVGPEVEAVAGSYEATVFTVTIDGTTTDVLADGGSLELDLGTDRTVTGRLFIPGGDEGGGDLDASMAGTWSLASDVVTFDHPVDTFVRDMDFRVEQNRLIGEETFGDATIRVTLSRSGAQPF